MRSSQSSICSFGEASVWPTQSFVRKFRDELNANCQAEFAGKIVNEESLVAAGSLI